MATLTLRLVKGSPLTHAEGDDNFTNLNNELATKLSSASYTASDVLSKLLTVDGAGSGIDADLLDGQQGSYYTDIAARLGFTPVNKAGDTMTGPLALASAAGNGLAVTRTGSTSHAGGDHQFQALAVAPNNTRFDISVTQTDVNFIAGGSTVNPNYIWRNNDTTEQMRLSKDGYLSVGPDAAPSGVQFSVRGADQANPTLGAVARFNSAGQISLRIGNSGYAYSWLQSIQDDGTNNLKNLVLNPSGGSVGVGMNPTEKLQVRLERGQVETYETVQGVAFRALASNTYGAYTVYQEAGTAHSFVIGKQAGSDVLVLGDGDLSSFAIRWLLNSGGHFLPGANEAYDIGATSLHVSNVWSKNLNYSGAGSLYINATNAAGFVILRAASQDIIIAEGSTGKGYYAPQGSTAYEIGFRGLPDASVTTGAFGSGDSGKRVKATAGVTIPNSTMANGDVVHVLNTTAGALTITKSITTAYNKNTGAALGATFTLAARGSMDIEFTSSTECYVGGNIS